MCVSDEVRECEIVGVGVFGLMDIESRRTLRSQRITKRRTNSKKMRKMTQEQRRRQQKSAGASLEPADECSGKTHLDSLYADPLELGNILLD